MEVVVHQSVCLVGIRKILAYNVYQYSKCNDYL